jgi:hypothetical protein
MRWSMMRLVEACVESHGGHSEHLNKRTLLTITLKLHVPGHFDMNIVFYFLMWNSCPKLVRTFQLRPVYMHMYVRMYVCVCVFSLMIEGRRNLFSVTFSCATQEDGDW